MRTTEASFSPHHGRPAGGLIGRATLILQDPSGPGALVARPRQLTDRVLSRVFGSRLDRQLAAGRPSE